MNRTNSLIIFVSITLTTFLIPIATTTTTTINTSAFEDSSYSQLTEYIPEVYDQYNDNYESGHYEDRYGKTYYIE